MRWNDSGITNSFAYEMVGLFSPHVSMGFLDCVKSGTLTRNWDANYRESLSLDIDGDEPPIGCLVRVWHTAEKDGESVQTLMGTFMQVSNNLSYKHGRYVGTMSLQSCLYRHGTDKRANNRNVGSGTNVATHFNSIVTASGGDPYIDPEIDTTKTFAKTHVWEFGESVLTECHECADRLGGMVHTDAEGRTVIKPYILPADRPVSWILTGDDVLCGLARTDPEIINAIGVKYTPEGSQTSQFASARKGDADPWSYKSIGRNALETHEYTSLSGTLQQKADALLASVSTGRTWTAQMPYAPLEVGSRGQLVYVDSRDNDMVLTVDAIIGAIEIDLDTMMLMQLSLEEVA